MGVGFEEKFILQSYSKVKYLQGCSKVTSGKFYTFYLKLYGEFSWIKLNQGQVTEVKDFKVSI